MSVTRGRNCDIRYHGCLRLVWCFGVFASMSRLERVLRNVTGPHDSSTRRGLRVPAKSTSQEVPYFYSILFYSSPRDGRCPDVTTLSRSPNASMPRLLARATLNAAYPILPKSTLLEIPPRTRNTRSPLWSLPYEPRDFVFGPLLISLRAPASVGRGWRSWLGRLGLHGQHVGCC